MALLNALCTTPAGRKVLSKPTAPNEPSWLSAYWLASFTSGSASNRLYELALTSPPARLVM